MGDGVTTSDRCCGGSPRRTVSDPAARPPALSRREQQVLLTWLRHDTKDDAARELYITVNTLRTHIQRIRDKYAAVGRRAPTKAALFVRAIQDGLIDIDRL